MGQKSTILAVGLIVFAVILAILFIVSRVIGTPKSNETKNETTSSQVVENVVPIAKIIGSPAVYNGYNLAVDSQISGWTTNNSFYFREQNSGFLGTNGGGLLLVVAKNPFQLPQDSYDQTCIII